jgi:hypothetical protein
MTLVAVLFLAQALHLTAADAQPRPLTRIGNSEKICQLTGEKDWETGRPTAAKTFSKAGLDAVDLGYPIEHQGKLILLFGDSWPPPHGGGPAGEIPADDAVGVTTRTEPPTKDACLQLQINHNRSGEKRFAPATVAGPTRVKQGFFNVPSGGVSAAGALFAFFWTNHCSDPNDLQPSVDRPLSRPPPTPKCPETDDRNSVGRSVMAQSKDEGRSFSQVVPMPTGFVYATAVDSSPLTDLPEDQRRGVFIFGVPRYRASVPYLAYSPAGSLADATWAFFTGREANGRPKWVTRGEWNAARLPWRPPGEAEVFRPPTNLGRCLGEISVTWNRPLHMWLMLYNGVLGIAARVAPAPWGPWSEPTRLLGGPDDIGCKLVMTPDGCGNRRDFWPDGHINGKFVGGGLYAPFVLDRYTTGDGGRRSTIYWVVSTWNPYEVNVMRTTIEK